MPRPVFILCSESGAEDKLTNFISFFGLIEKLTYRRNVQGAAQPLKMRITATWMREDGDDGQEFELQFLFVMPPDRTELVFAESVFSFSDGKPFYRNVAVLETLLPPMGNGIMEIVCRVRRQGSTSWTSQSYPIVIEEMRDEQPAGSTTGLPPASESG